MKVSEAYPSKYLSAADLQGREVKVTIGQIDFEALPDGKRKPVIYFHNKSKGLVVNKTNANTMSDMFGDEMDDWLEKEIVLYSTRAEYQGKRVDAIRVKFVQPPPSTRAQERRAGAGRPQPPAQSAGAQPRPYDERNPPPDDRVPDDMNDGIPF